MRMRGKGFIQAIKKV